MSTDETDRPELVDDPFQPGEKVRASLADVHPAERFERSVLSAYEKRERS